MPFSGEKDDSLKRLLDRAQEPDDRQEKDGEKENDEKNDPNDPE
jgi:hypothetical protein